MTRLLLRTVSIAPLVLASRLLGQAPGAPAIDTGPRGIHPPPVKKEVLVPAPAAEVWKALTTTDGVKTFFAPDANVDLKPGGPYEIYFFPDAAPGGKGCDGCTVVSFEPERSLVVTWSFPPSIPALREAKVFAKVSFTLAADGPTRTKLLLVHDGFPSSRDGARGRTYFADAWDTVMGRLVERFATGPVDWKKKP